MKRLIITLKSDRYKYLIDFLVLFAFVQGVIFILGGKEFLSEDSYLLDTVVRISASMMIFLFGCAGFVGMIRQEFRQIIPIKGKTAQVVGFILWMFSWWLDMYIIVNTISH